MSILKSYSYGKQTIDEDDIQAVVNVLKSDMLTQGPQIGEFENALKEILKAKHAAAVVNGTAGLHLIGLALNWGQNDLILTSPITFLASANCILYTGSTPDFVDIDEQSYTIDVNKLEDKIKFYTNKNKKVKAVVAIDYAGHPCDWKSLRELANRYDFQLVNDCCHAIGSEYENNIGYAAAYADVVNLSFHPVKHITTGEGGAVITNRTDIDSKVKILRTHGMTKDPALLEKNDGPWYYEMHFLGYNYRITDFQCALGSSQLKKLPQFISARRKIAQYYDSQFINYSQFKIPSVNGIVKHAYHLYPLQINFDSIKISKSQAFEKLKQFGINCQVHYVPIHLQPYYKKMFGFKIGDFPVAEKFYQNEVSIPIYPALKEDDVEYISTTIKHII